MINVIGYLAALLTTLSFLPQVMRVLRDRDVSGISLLMYMMFTCGVMLWLIYGVLLMSWPIILSNLVTLLLSGAILYHLLRARQVRK